MLSPGKNSNTLSDSKLSSSLTLDEIQHNINTPPLVYRPEQPQVLVDTKIEMPFEILKPPNNFDCAPEETFKANFQQLEGDPLKDFKERKQKLKEKIEREKMLRDLGRSMRINSLA